MTVFRLSLRGLDCFLRGIELDQASSCNQIIKLSRQFRSRYHRYRTARTIATPIKFINLGIYQLYNFKWLKMENSPLNPSGCFHPRECFLSEKPSHFFPTLSTRK